MNNPYLTKAKIVGRGDTLIRREEVLRRTGLPKSTLYTAIAEGTFPAPVPISERSRAWVEQEVDDWIAARIAARLQPPIGWGCHAPKMKDSGVSK